MYTCTVKISNEFDFEIFRMPDNPFFLLSGIPANKLWRFDLVLLHPPETVFILGSVEIVSEIGGRKLGLPEDWDEKGPREDRLAE